MFNCIIYFVESLFERIIIQYKVLKIFSMSKNDENEFRRAIAGSLAQRFLACNILGKIFFESHLEVEKK